MKIIYKIQEKMLPTALLKSDEYSGLNEIQKQNFRSRLNFIEEICVKSKRWIENHKDFESNADFIDNLELDLFVNLSIDGADNIVSPWIMHSSWTFETTSNLMLDTLPERLKSKLSLPGVGFQCDESKVLSWLNGCVECLYELLDHFYNAKDFHHVMAGLIGINVCLLVMLEGVSKQRFNKNVYS